MIQMDLSVAFPLNKNKFEINLKELLFSKPLAKPGQILSSILNTDVGQQANKIFECTSTMQSIILNDDKDLDEFIKRHASMNYNHLFEQKESSSSFFTRRRKVKGKTVYRESEPSVKHQAHPALIRECCAKIMHHVITPKLFGNNRNKKKILKTLFRLMQTAKSESFSLLPLVEQINTASIEWLFVEDRQLKLIFVAKFLKWIFRYFILLISRYFSITYIKEERIFLFIKDYSKEIRKYLATKCKKGVLEKCSTNEYDINSIETKMCVLPKKDSFRIITRRKYDIDGKQTLRKVLGILRFLFNTYLKSSTSLFDKSYMNVVIKANQSSKKLYITSSDIQDAFGSIIQSKLLDILTTLFDRLPEVLELSEFYKKGVRGKVYTYMDPNVNFPRKGKKVFIKKCDVLGILENNIFNTKIQMHNKVYNLCKGVAQGSMLSAVLNDIYYGSMQQKYFAYFRKSGYIYTHVDDIIYFTTNEEAATLYLNRIKKGIPEYNCWFKKSKIVSNLDSTSEAAGVNSVQKIEFLNWSIDCTTLEVEPLIKTSARYSLTYTTSLDPKKLMNKLSNIESIKLKKLVLHKEINNRDKILKNIKIIFQRQAKLCFAIANHLEDSKVMTFQVINETNFRILKKIEAATGWTKTEKENNRKEVLYIIWKSFYTIFIKRSNRFLHLVKPLKKMMVKNKLHFKKHKNHPFNNRPQYLGSKRAKYN